MLTAFFLFITMTSQRKTTTSHRPRFPISATESDRFAKYPVALQRYGFYLHNNKPVSDGRTDWKMIWSSFNSESIAKGIGRVISHRQPASASATDYSISDVQYRMSEKSNSTGGGRSSSFVFCHCVGSRVIDSELFFVCDTKAESFVCFLQRIVYREFYKNTFKFLYPNTVYIVYNVNGFYLFLFSKRKLFVIFFLHGDRRRKRCYDLFVMHLETSTLGGA